MLGQYAFGHRVMFAAGGGLVDPAMGVDFAQHMLVAAAVTCPRAFL